MTVILPFHSGDRDQAVRLISQIQSFGTQGRFFLLTQKANQDPALLPPGWEWLTDWNAYSSKWSSGTVDATGPNMMWQQAARDACRIKVGPWLWLEPDCAPLSPNWLSALEAEYQRGNKPFMGGVAPTGGRMSGVAIYPQNTAQMCLEAMTTRELAFDVAGQREFNKRGIHLTPLIADQFRCPPFADQADFNARVPREAVLHHGDKTGSIYPFIGGTSYEPQPEVIHMGDPVVFQRVPDRPDQITDMLNQKANDTPVVLTVVQHLDCIMELVGDSKPKRAMLYGELQKRGIECGRKPKKAALRKTTAKAH